MTCLKLMLEEDGVRMPSSTTMPQTMVIPMSELTTPEPTPESPNSAQSNQSQAEIDELVAQRQQVQRLVTALKEFLRINDEFGYKSLCEMLPHLPIEPPHAKRPIKRWVARQYPVNSYDHVSLLVNSLAQERSVMDLLREELQQPI